MVGRLRWSGGCVGRAVGEALPVGGLCVRVGGASVVLLATSWRWLGGALVCGALAEHFVGVGGGKDSSGVESLQPDPTQPSPAQPSPSEPNLTQPDLPPQIGDHLFIDGGMVELVVTQKARPQGGARGRLDPGSRNGGGTGAPSRVGSPQNLEGIAATDNSSALPETSRLLPSLKPPFSPPPPQGNIP